MQSTAHQSIGANTLNPAADRIPAAAHLTVPKLRIPLTSVVEQGPETEVASLLTELSHRVDLSDILKRNHIANNALAESFRKWLNEFISPDVDRLLDLTVTLYPVQRKWYHNEYEVDGTLPKEDWIFQISMNHVDYYNFDISAQIAGYEANNPGLGQYLLRTIDRCPYELGTPSYLFSIIRYFFWGDMENEWEFARELYGDCLSDLKCVLRDIPVRRKELERKFPQWALFPKQERKRNIPSEIRALAKIAGRKPRFKHMVFPRSNLPGILLWEDSGDLWERSLGHIEEDVMNAGEDIQFNGAYWSLPLNDPAKLQEVFSEIEVYVKDFHDLLQAVLNIKRNVK